MKLRNNSNDLCKEENISNEYDNFQPDEIIEDFLLRTRRILLVGEIDEALSTNICSYLQIFALKKEPIYIYINTSGGCLTCGYAIIDQMLACQCPIYTIVRGQGYSMGAIIAAFGTKGCRYATPNSSLMLHPIIIQSQLESIDQHSLTIEYLRNDYNQKIRGLAKKIGIKLSELKKIMGTTSWMTPQMAIKIGLIDGVWTKTMENKIKVDYVQ